MCLSLSQTTPISNPPRVKSGCDCSRSHVAFADNKCVCAPSLCGDAGAFVESKPFASRVRSRYGSSCDEEEEVLLVECEEDSTQGSSTKQGGWWRGGDEECLVALRFSFSVWDFCSRSLRRSLSVCREEVVVVKRLSLISRSRTWRSLRSRKARWLVGVFVRKQR
jgi:hypothetical protein